MNKELNDLTQEAARRTTLWVLIGIVVGMALIGFVIWCLESPCGMLSVRSSIKSMEAISNAMQTVLADSASVSVDQLSNYVGKARVQDRAANSLAVPACLDLAKVKLTTMTGMGYLSLMDNGSFTRAAEYDISIESLNSFKDEITRIKACAPFCPP